MVMQVFICPIAFVMMPEDILAELSGGSNDGLQYTY